MNLDELASDTGFITILLVSLAFTYIVFGAKFTFYLLVVLLMGQVLINWKVFDNLIKRGLPE